MADHKEYWSTESDQGSIRISEDVVASIAALSASETKITRPQKNISVMPL